MPEPTAVSPRAELAPTGPPTGDHSPATRCLALAYSLHVALMMTGAGDHGADALSALSADLVRELHALDLRLSGLPRDA